MSDTRGRWTASTPFTDGQLFLGASKFTPLVAASAVPASAGAGLFTLNIPASTTANLFAELNQILRTGQLATNAVNQEQFGTAALVPGPSAVANTSDPLNLPSGFPPWTNSVNPTITGGQKGATPKGIQINWVDLSYEVDTGAITSATFGLTTTKMPTVATSAAPVVTNVIALGANGLPTAVNTAGQATRTRITVASPTFFTLDGTEVIANANFVTPAANTVKFYGAILGVTYNWA
jgi:hypothetical protein